jgi:hypothetical protein
LEINKADFGILIPEDKYLLGLREIRSTIEIAKEVYSLLKTMN